MKLLISSLFVVLVFAASILGSYWLSLHAIDVSQGHWCQALDILTRQKVPKPANPASNPSREHAYQFYLALKDIEHSFRCR